MRCANCSRDVPGLAYQEGTTSGNWASFDLDRAVDDGIVPREYAEYQAAKFCGCDGTTKAPPPRGDGAE
jgi:hypothetical protein